MSALRKRIAWMPSPPLAPDDHPVDRPVLDGAHLERMTLGQRELEQEVLGLFLQQMTQVMNMLEGLGADSAVLAHTLKGAALGIGAFRVAEAAQAVEQAARARETDALRRAMEDLRDAVEATRGAIATRQAGG